MYNSYIQTNVAIYSTYADAHNLRIIEQYKEKSH